MIERLLEKKIFDALLRETEHSDCFLRKYSSAITINNQVIGLGHSLIPYGEKCSETGICPREALQSKHGHEFEFFESCPIIHAEMTAILSCRSTEACDGAALYLLGITMPDNAIHKNAFPCSLCLRHIAYVGIKAICIVQKEDSCHEFTFMEGKFQ